MNSRRTFWFSLGMNGVLLAVAALLWRGNFSPTKPPATKGQPTLVSPKALPDATSLASSESAPPPVAYVTNQFNWRQLESDDWVKLAADLRVIGCPERTIHDLISARARRALDRIPRETEARLPFWTTGLKREKAERESGLRAASLRAGIIVRAEQVVGPAAFVEDPLLAANFVDQAVVGFFSGPMSEETFSRLTLAITQHETRTDEFNSRLQGIRLPEDEVEAARMREELRQQIAAILTPGEFDEFSARLGFLKLADDIRFDATDLNPAEIRQVALIRGRLGDIELGEWFNGNDLTEEQEAEFSDALRRLLGEQRYAQVERAADDDFQNLFELGQEHGLPRTAAVQAFELRQLAVEEVTRLRADASLSAAERDELYSTALAEAQNALRKVLGAEAFAEYLAQHGAWVTNVTKL